MKNIGIIVVSMCLVLVDAWLEVWTPHKQYKVEEGQTVALMKCSQLCLK